MRRSKSYQLCAGFFLLCHAGELPAVHGFEKASSAGGIGGGDPRFFNRTLYNKPFATPARSAMYELHGGGGSTKVKRPRTYKIWQPPPPVTWEPVAHPSRDGAAVLMPRPSMRTPTPKFLVATKQKKNSKAESSSALSRVDVSVAMAYFCNAFCITLPIILAPMIAQSYNLKSSDLTTFCGKVASIAIMGGGFGKIINGLVCQKLGGITTASTYLLGLGASSLALSLSTSLDAGQWLVAGMEFFSSAMWVSSCVVLSNHHAGNALKFARGVTFLSLASTAAQLLAKTLGAALLKVMNWRQVAQLGAILALIGSVVVQTVVAKDVASASRKQQQQQQQQHNERSLNDEEETSIPSVIRKAKSVVSSRLFWIIGIAHVSGFLAKTSDRMMGPFLRDVTGLSCKCMVYINNESCLPLPLLTRIISCLF
jgi:hypothetical protein